MVSTRLSYPQTAVEARPASRRCPLGRFEVALFILAACILVIIALVSAKGLMASDEPVMSLEIQVGHGDTLWSIAQEYGDPSKYILARVHELAKANGLERGEALREGQTLIIPVSSRCAKLYCGGTYASRQIPD